MSLIKLKFVHRGSSLIPLVYDTRWGTATAADGTITFGLNTAASCRRVWVNNSATNTGSDSNDGLSAATAKLTWNAAHAVYTGTGCKAGDQLMVAEGSSLTVSRNSSMNSVASATANMTYMSVVQTYDPADAANTAKYGNAIGAAVPILNLDINLGTDLNVSNGVGIGYVALKGLEVKAVNQLACQSAGITWQTNAHPGMVYQLCRFNGVGLSTSSGLGTTSSAANIPNAGLISKCSQWNSTGLFIEETEAFRIQEFFSAHCGWNIEAVRDDPIVYGGASTFAHAFYLHASNTNLWLNRVICVDATDGLGARCGSPYANQLISVDNPVGLNSSGKSGDIMVERPDGAPWYCDDAVIMGLDKEICPGQPGGWAFEWVNNIAGSYTRNVAAFDFDSYGVDPTDNRYAAGTRITASQVPQYMLLDKWSGWRVAVTGESDSVGSDGANYHFSVTNSVLDVVPTGYNGSITSVSARVSAPAGYLTRAQTYAALGYANKALWVNAMCYRPDLIGQMAQAMCGISLPAMGLTPLYQTASPPTAITGAPVVYPIALADLTASTLTLAHATAGAILLSGVAAASSLSSSDLPTGFSMTAARLSTSGTVTSGSNQITSVGSISGIQKGMLVEAKSSAFTTTSLFPLGTVVTAVSGTTITCSANATGSSSSQSILVSAGGRLISYDASRTAGSYTFHILETAKDTAMGSHTTAFTVTLS